MNDADRLTASRLFMSPAFFALFMWGESLGIPSAAVVAALVALFVAIELSDLLDGIVARRSGTVSSFGKLFDPFADVFARITYFVCFAWSGIMPLWILVVILYREFGILFLRMLMAQRGVALAARPGGKLKAVTYMVAGSLSLLHWSLPRLGLAQGTVLEWSRWLALAACCLAALLAVASFVDYWLHSRRAYPKAP